MIQIATSPQLFCYITLQKLRIQILPMKFCQSILYY